MVGHGKRILIYSHDTFGLGHLRRCRAIAHALVERHKNTSVLILSGSPIIGSFDFRSRVDFVRIPGVIKLRDGEYTSLNLHIDIRQTLDIRASIIEHTAEFFEPHLFLVDKEPLGLGGEVAHTLERLKDRGTPLVLGLRDVMDEPSLLAPEWQRKNVEPALAELYDEIWIYGLEQIWDPLDGLDLSDEVLRKIVYTGYLRRQMPSLPRRSGEVEIPDEPYLLVTPGGGGDGENLIDWVLRAYECDPGIPCAAVVVLGPFMASDAQARFQDRAARLDRIRMITFDAHIEALMAGAEGIVAMGGYNTFCEILSFNKRALIVPRMAPRLEQYIRASRAQHHGLLRMLPDDTVRDAAVMAAALAALPDQKPPGDVVFPGLMDGVDRVNERVDHWINPPGPRLAAGSKYAFRG
ncbi:MAG: glycosyltransferase [Alphaproteobacteria bacterium]|nr:glycosyltransferase [Alphaproteobacteria bacterium]